jgi:hypothetical protein
MAPAKFPAKGSRMAKEVFMLKRLGLPIAAAATAALIIAVLVVAVGGPAHAQRHTSPPANVSAVIGGKKINVD